MTAESPLPVRLDAALDRVQGERTRVQREAPSALRSLRMAELWEREARLWQVLFAHSRVRVYWRAALVAELYARECARRWVRDAAAHPRITLRSAGAGPGVADIATVREPAPLGHLGGGS
jgi:hypothetical protein